MLVAIAHKFRQRSLSNKSLLIYFRVSFFVTFKLIYDRYLDQQSLSQFSISGMTDSAPLSTTSSAGSSGAGAAGAVSPLPLVHESFLAPPPPGLLHILMSSDKCQVTLCLIHLSVCPTTQCLYNFKIKFYVIIS